MNKTGILVGEFLSPPVQSGFCDNGVGRKKLVRAFSVAALFRSFFRLCFLFKC